MAISFLLKNSTKTTAPAATDLANGEIALGLASGAERLYVKNASGTVKYINVTDEERAVLNKMSIDGNGNLKIDTNVYSTGDLSAYGAGAGTGGTGGGLISTVLDSGDLGGSFLDTDYSNTFNAFAINLINNNVNSATARIASLETGSATNLQTLGTGNVVTNLTKSGSTLTIVKNSNAVLEGDSRLTDARKNPNSLSFSGYSTLTYDGSAAVTVPIPTKVSQLTNDSAFLTSINKSQVEAALTGVATGHTHSQYLTGNQTVTLSGDATGAGTTSIAVTLANSGVGAGTYKSVTVDAKGRVTAGTNPTNLADYGITDALPTSSGGTVNGSLTVTGNLVVNGSSVTVNSTSMSLKDPVILLGSDSTINDGKDRGVQINYFDTTGKTGFFGLDASTGYFTFIPNATNTNEVFSGSAGDIQAANFRGNLIGGTVAASTITATGTVTAPTFSGALSGNATTSTTLATSRNFSIGGASGLSGATISFNGGSDVALQLAGTLKISNGGTNMTAINQGGIVYGASTSAMASTAAGTSGYVLVSNGTGAPSWNKLDLTYMPESAYKKNVVAATTVNLAATGTTTVLTSTVNGALVLDGVTIAVNDRVLIKNQTDTTKNGIYVVTNVGSASTLWSMTRATSADSSLEIGGGTVNVNAGTVNGGHLFSNNFKTTDTLGTTSMPWYYVYSDFDSATANTANKLVLRDASGNFSAGTITASLSGNSSTATKLATARNIALSGVVTGNANFDGSGNITLTTSISVLDGGTW